MRRKKTEKANAFHEAGHAVAAYHYHLGVGEITVEGTRDFGGRMTIRRRSLKDRRIAEAYAVTRLAGPEAQRKYNPRSITRARHEDHEEADRVLNDQLEFDDDQLFRAYVKYIRLKARVFVEKKWKLIDSLARELLVTRTMGGEDVERFLRERKAGK